MRLMTLASVLASTLLCANSALADIHEVKMLNRGAGGAMVYEPDYLKIAPGDTVKFLPTQSGHNAASITELLPAGAEAFKSKINQPLEQTFNVPGLYGIQCIPHVAMGMVMLIEVGDGGVLPALPASLPARAAERFASIVQREKDAR